MRLQFSWGTTRFVILVGTVAIKFARLRPFRALYRLAKHQMNGEVRVKLVKFDGRPFIGGIKYIFAGIIANRNEYRLWHTSPRYFLMPTLYSFGGGLVNVQELGKSISQEELDVSHPFQEILAGMPPEFVYDMTRSANFCRYKNRTCLVDYGSEETFILFLRPQSRDAYRLTT